MAADHDPPTAFPRRAIAAIAHSIAAPEAIRTMVKLAGSMLVSARASRHRMELAANASIATAVSAIVLARLLLNRRNGFQVPEGHPSSAIFQ